MINSLNIHLNALPQSSLEWERCLCSFLMLPKVKHATSKSFTPSQYILMHSLKVLSKSWKNVCVCFLCSLKLSMLNLNDSLTQKTSRCTHSKFSLRVGQMFVLLQMQVHLQKQPLKLSKMLCLPRSQSILSLAEWRP